MSHRVYFHRIFTRHLLFLNFIISKTSLYHSFIASAESYKLRICLTFPNVRHSNFPKYETFGILELHNIIHRIIDSFVNQF
jgi:hypothetical protein